MAVKKPYLRNALFFGVAGVLYSFLFPIISGFHLYYMPRLSLLHSVLIAVGFASLGLLTTTIKHLKYSGWLTFLLWIPVGIHFGYWYTSYAPDPLGIEVYSSGLIIFLLSVLLATTLTQAHQSLASKSNPIVLAVLLILLLVSNYLLLSFLPTQTLLTNSEYYTFVNKDLQKKGPLDNYLYPLCQTFLSGVTTYQPILPEIPPGKKIFVVVLDALRPDYISREINGQPVAPILKKFSEHFYSFPTAHAQASWTKASIASLYTGKYVRDHQTYWGSTKKGVNEYRGHVLPESLNTLAERLKRAGFQTFGSVKSGHLAARYQYDQGFDVYIDLLNGYRGDQAIYRQLLFWLYHQTPRKIFAYLHVNGPHQPFDLAYKNMSFLKNTDYYQSGRLQLPGRFYFTTNDVTPILRGDVTLTKQEIGVLRTLYATKLNLYDKLFVRNYIATLRNVGIYEDSLLTFTSDHGEALYEHENYAHGNDLYEETVRIPLMMKPPNAPDTGNIAPDLNLEAIDLTATLADYGNASVDNLSGTSFLPYLRDKPVPDEYRKNFDYAFTEQAKNHPYIPQAAVYDPPWKYIHSFRNDSGTLYNLENDPGEQNPLKNRNSEKSRLRNVLFSRLRSDSSIRRPESNLKKATEKGYKQFEDLGYIY